VYNSQMSDSRTVCSLRFPIRQFIVTFFHVVLIVVVCMYTMVSILTLDYRLILYKREGSGQMYAMKTPIKRIWYSSTRQ